MKRLAAGCVRG